MAVSPITCGFCRRDQRTVRKLICGRAGVAICDDCVSLAAGCLAAGTSVSDGRATMRPEHGGRPCSFCGKVGRVAVDRDAVVCTECLDLCAEVLAEVFASTDSDQT